MIKANKHKHSTLKILYFTLWLLFVLLNAYYGGAMTMFFSLEGQIPFQGITEGLGKHYPDWKPYILQGSNLAFDLAANEDPKDARGKH